MREIKFRSWNVKYNVMSYCGEGKYYTDTQGQILDCFDSKYIMQYTGLKDKSGKEIYEGDIVSGPIYKGTYIQKSRRISSGVLEWNNTANGRYINTALPKGYFSSISFSDCTIIGNIYENPELIEKS